MRRSRERKKKRRKLRILLTVVAILFLVGAGYAFTVYQSFSSALKNMHEGIDRQSDLRDSSISLSKKDPFSILLLGVDERENDKGRSDTMIVMTINPNEESVHMLSIPRDTRAEIVGNGTIEKINHAYARGGIEMSMASVENLLDIPIDHYIQVNMEGFVDIVEAVGGVTVVNDMDLNYQGYHFPEGELNLNGEEALVYSRIRKGDPRGDFGRQLRQKQVISAVIDQGASLSSLWKFDGIFDALGDNIKTSLSFEEMMDVQKHYRSAASNIHQHQFEKGTNQTIDRLSYYVVNEEELAEYQTMLKKHLELD
ncbi:LCP family protein [Bacillus kexueae]|uniref:LCP family glycopolymer transferase n=1 Tax=Aeribacillus kexueae TaxID=2078952 RepID=UPI001FAE8CA5|nr:LCP family protein [Bacillus kexueae]